MSFNGDINLFLKVAVFHLDDLDNNEPPLPSKYLTENEGVSPSQYLKTAQAGTEATSGSATLTTSVTRFDFICSSSLHRGLGPHTV